MSWTEKLVEHRLTVDEVYDTNFVVLRASEVDEVYFSCKSCIDVSCGKENKEVFYELLFSTGSIILASIVKTAWERDDARFRFVAPTERFFVA